MGQGPPRCIECLRGGKSSAACPKCPWCGTLPPRRLLGGDDLKDWTDAHLARHLAAFDRRGVLFDSGLGPIVVDSLRFFDSRGPSQGALDRLTKAAVRLAGSNFSKKYVDRLARPRDDAETWFAAHAETGEFLGYIHGYLRYCNYGGIRSGRESHIDQIAVLPSRKGLGIGSFLMDEWLDVVSADLPVTAWAVEGMAPFFEQWRFELADPPTDDFLQPVSDAGYMRLESHAAGRDADDASS